MPTKSLSLSKPKRSVPITVVVTLEGLTAASLGCYGCSWNHTPGIDALAGRGIVWDRWTSPTDQPGDLIGSWLRGTRAALSGLPADAGSLLVTDDERLSIPEDGFGFESVVRLTPRRPERAAGSLESSNVARSFATAIENLAQRTRLVWVHSALLRDVWDLHETPIGEEELEPEPCEEETGEEETPLPETQPCHLPEDTRPPVFRCTADDHPDWVLSWMRRYAAMVEGIDQMIEALAAAVRHRPATIVVAGASGFSLGENGWVGHRVGPLRSPEIRLPLVVSAGGPLHVPTLADARRLPELLQRLVNGEPLVTPELWCRRDAEFSPAVETTSDRSGKAVTTAEWFYVLDDAQGLAEERLFLKPDDQHDVNDVSRLQREVLDRFASDQWASLDPLP
jgi:hypothetical protein